MKKKSLLKTTIKWIIIWIAAYVIVNNATVGGVDKAFWQIHNFFAIDSTHSTEENTNGFKEATVLRVVDGDTVMVNTSYGEIKVRMLGVNTPESVHSDKTKNTKEGTVASEFTKSYLKEGMTVYLEYDKDTLDDYGRTLAYIWLSDTCNKNDFDDFCKYNYGAILLQNTYCEAVYYEPNGKYREWYEKLDTQY